MVIRIKWSDNMPVLSLRVKRPCLFLLFLSHISAIAMTRAQANFLVPLGASLPSQAIPVESSQDQPTLSQATDIRDNQYCFQPLSFQIGCYLEIVM